MTLPDIYLRGNQSDDWPPRSTVIKLRILVVIVSVFADFIIEIVIF